MEWSLVMKVARCTVTLWQVVSAHNVFVQSQCMISTPSVGSVKMRTKRHN